MLPKSPLIPHSGAPSKGEVGSVLMYKAVGAEKRTRARELERVDWVLSACYLSSSQCGRRLCKCRETGMFVRSVRLCGGTSPIHFQ